MIVLDTNVLSELMRSSPDPAVSAWVAARPASSLFTTTVTEAEIRYGVAVLPPGRRRRELQLALDGLFGEDLAGRVLSFDRDAAAAYASIVSRRRVDGRPISQFDAQIAAIAASRDAALATRNVRDFDGIGLVVVDPWG